MNDRRSIASSVFGIARVAANSAGMTKRPTGASVVKSVIDVVFPQTLLGGASGRTAGSLRSTRGWARRPSAATIGTRNPMNSTSSSCPAPSRGGTPSSSKAAHTPSATAHITAPAASSRQNAVRRRDRVPSPRRQRTTAAAAGGSSRRASPIQGAGSTCRSAKYRTAKASPARIRRRVRLLASETGAVIPPLSSPPGTGAPGGVGSAARPSCCRRWTACVARRVAARSDSSDSRGCVLRSASSAHPPTAISGLFISWATPVAKWT